MFIEIVGETFKVVGGNWAVVNSKLLLTQIIKWGYLCYVICWWLNIFAIELLKNMFNEHEICF